MAELASEIRTERLILRPLRAEDAPRYADLSNDIGVAGMTGSIPFPHPAICAEGFILLDEAGRALGRNRTFGIETAADGLIGMAVVYFRDRETEIGYWLGRPFWGRGYGSEVASALRDFARGAGARRIVANHFADNPASGRVLEKAGFAYTGEVRQAFSLARRARAPSRAMLCLA